jgi:hypothetical protein
MTRSQIAKMKAPFFERHPEAADAGTTGPTQVLLARWWTTLLRLVGDERVMVWMVPGHRTDQRTLLRTGG